jgi:hypothetical protein
MRSSIARKSAFAAAALLGWASAALPQGDEMVWEESVEVDAGRAFQGPWRMNESRFLYVDDPTVAIADSGAVAVAWVDNAAKEVLFQAFTRDGAERLDAPANVSRSPDTFSWLPRMAICDGDTGNVAVLWQEIIFSGGSHGGEILFARSTDGGATFSEPVNLSNTVAGAGKGRLSARYWHNGSLDLAAGADGLLYAAWTEYEGGLWLSRSVDGGEHFSAPLRVAGDDARPARGPTLAVDGEGNVYLAWTVGEDRAADIRFTRSRDQGRSFEEPRVIGQSSGHADAPKLGVDRRGALHLVYGERDAGSSEGYQIRYVRSDDGGTTFSAPRRISGEPMQGYDGASFPHVATDGKNNLYVLWELFPRGQPRSAGLAFAFSSDGGPTFSTPEVVPGTVPESDDAINGGLQGLLMSKLAVNEAGDVAVVNSRFERGASSHVTLYRGRLTE